MKIVIKTLNFVFLIVAFTTCRKEIKEPPANTRNDNFVYMEIDGERFMVEDRSWNLNKNSRGSFDVYNRPINVEFLDDSLIRVGFEANNFDAGKKKKFRVMKMGASMELRKEKGKTIPKQIQIVGKSYTENKLTYFDFDISKNNALTPTFENNSYKNCSFLIKDYNENERTINIIVKGSIENSIDNKKLVPVYINIKLKNNSKQ